MKASLSTFSAIEVEGRRIAVLGDMLELGNLERECHERIGSIAAASQLDYLICVGELSKSIADAARRAGFDSSAVSCHQDADTVVDELLPLLAPGDAVLVKASHSIGLDCVVRGLVS